MTQWRACVFLLVLAAAASFETRAVAQNSSCVEDEEVDFPITYIQFDKKSSANSDCGPGEYCESSPSFSYHELDGPACADFTADFLEDCDVPGIRFMPSPGCKRNVGLVCDEQYSDDGNELISAVCRREIGEACTSNSDCFKGWSESPDIVCTDGKCQQYGYAEDCSAKGERCSAGQVCQTQDSSRWIDSSTPRYACFNRADRGEPCKPGYTSNGHGCKDETEVDYKLLCFDSDVYSVGNIPKDSVGVCKSYSYEIGAECNENMLCGQSECINGKCEKVEEPARTECSVNTDCDPRTTEPLEECLNGRCVFLGFRGFCFAKDDTCPGGQTCWLTPTFDGLPKCIERAAKGEPCKVQRWGPFDKYACKPNSETGYDMSCIFGDDAKGLPGPGPGGAGGGIDGIGKCMQIIEEGDACGEDKLLICRPSPRGVSCVNGMCQASS